MPYSRRKFIESSVLAFAASPIALSKPSKLFSASDQQYELLFGEQKLFDIRERYRFDPRWTPHLKRFMSLDVPSVLEESGALETSDIPAKSSELLDSSLHYLITQVNVAQLYPVTLINTLSSLEKWDRLVNADDKLIGLDYAAQNVMAISFGIDWLGKVLPKEFRAELVVRLAKRGLEPIYRGLKEMQTDEDYSGWRFDGQAKDMDAIPRDYIYESFLPIMSASALLVGCAVCQKNLGNNPELADWVETGINVLIDRIGLFYQDGSFPGSASQAILAAHYLAIATDVLSRADIVNLYDKVNWPGLSRYIEKCSYRDNGKNILVEFGDKETEPQSSFAYWIANKTRDGFSNYLGTEVLQNHQIWGLIWFNTRVQSVAPNPNSTLSIFDNGTISVKNTSASDSLFVLMRTGNPCHGEHGDLNSLVMGFKEEMFVVDPSIDPDLDSGVRIALRRPQSHSVLLINGESQNYNDGFVGVGRSRASSKIIRSFDSDQYAMWSVDATEAYRIDSQDLTLVVRTVFISYVGNMVAVVDKVISKGERVNVNAQFVLNNADNLSRARRRDGNILVTRNEASMFMSNFSVNGSIPDQGMGGILADQYPRLESRTVTPQQTQTLVSLFSFGSKDEDDHHRTEDRQGNLFVERDLDGKRVRLNIYNTDVIPEIAHTVRELKKDPVSSDQ